MFLYFCHSVSFHHIVLCEGISTQTERAHLAAPQQERCSFARKFFELCDVKMSDNASWDSWRRWMLLVNSLQDSFSIWWNPQRKLSSKRSSTLFTPRFPRHFENWSLIGLSKCSHAFGCSLKKHSVGISGLPMWLSCFSKASVPSKWQVVSEPRPLHFAHHLSNQGLGPGPAM